MKTNLLVMAVLAVGAQVSFAADNYVYCNSTDDSNLIVQVFHDGTEATKAEIAVSRVTGEPEGEPLGRFPDLTFRSEYVPELKRNVERYFGKGMNFSWRPIGRKQGPGGIRFTHEGTPYEATLRCVYTPKRARVPVERALGNFRCKRDFNHNLGGGIGDKVLDLEFSDENTLVVRLTKSRPGPARELRNEELVFSRGSDNENLYQNEKTTLWQFHLRDVPTLGRFLVLSGFTKADRPGKIAFTNFYDDGRGILRDALFHCR